MECYPDTIIPVDWEVAFRTSDPITRNVPGAHMSLPPKSILSVVVVQPEFPNWTKGENWKISDASGGIVYPIKKTHHSISFNTDKETLSPCFYRLTAVHVGHFDVSAENDKFIGFDIQKWIFAPLQFIIGLWNDFTVNKSIDKLELADATGMPINFGRTQREFKKAIEKSAKYIHTYSDEFVKIMSDGRAMQATGEPAVGIYYLEGSEYFQWGCSESPIQMYPPNSYNKFGSLNTTEKDLVFESRELFTCYDPKYVEFFDNVTIQCQLNCRMLTCLNSSDCCYRNNCCGVCASPSCCYTRECFNVPHELDLLLTEWEETVIEAVQTNSSLNIINDIFSKNTDDQYLDIDKIKEKLELSFSSAFIERHYELAVKKTKEDFVDDFDLETQIITKFYKILEILAFRQAVMAAFSKFRFRNRSMEIEDIFDAWRVAIDFGKPSKEFIADVKRRQIQIQAQDRVKILYNQTEDAWRVKQKLPPIRRTPLTAEEVKASYTEVTKSPIKKKPKKSKKTKKVNHK